MVKLKYLKEIEINEIEPYLPNNVMGPNDVVDLLDLLGLETLKNLGQVHIQVQTVVRDIERLTGSFGEFLGKNRELDRITRGFRELLKVLSAAKNKLKELNRPDIEIKNIDKIIENLSELYNKFNEGSITLEKFKLELNKALDLPGNLEALNNVYSALENISSQGALSFNDLKTNVEVLESVLNDLSENFGDFINKEDIDKTKNALKVLRAEIEKAATVGDLGALDILDEKLSFFANKYKKEVEGIRNSFKTIPPSLVDIGNTIEKDISSIERFKGAQEKAGRIIGKTIGGFVSLVDVIGRFVTIASSAGLQLSFAIQSVQFVVMSLVQYIMNNLQLGLNVIEQKISELQARATEFQVALQNVSGMFGQQVQPILTSADAFKATQITLQSMVGTASSATDIIKELYAQSINLSGTFEDLSQIISSMVSSPVIRSQIKTTEEMKQVLKESLILMQQMATINPQQGVEGALIALQELLGGQTRSLQLRFNLDLSQIEAAVGKSFDEVRGKAKETLKFLESFFGKIVPTDLLIQKTRTFSGFMEKVTDLIQASFVSATDTAYLSLMDLFDNILLSSDKTVLAIQGRQKDLKEYLSSIGLTENQIRVEFTNLSEFKSLFDYLKNNLTITTNRIAQSITQGIENIGKALSSSKVLSSLGVNLQINTDILSRIANIEDPVQKIILVLMSGLDLILKMIEDFIDRLFGSVQNAEATIKGVIDGFNKVIQVINKLDPSIIGEIVNGFATIQTLGAALGEIGPKITNISLKLGELMGIIGIIAGAIMGLFTAIMAVATIFTLINTLILGIIGLGPGIVKIFSLIKSISTGKGIKDVLGKIGEKTGTKNKLTKIGEGITNKLKGFEKLAKIGNYLSMILNKGITGVFARFITRLLMLAGRFIIPILIIIGGIELLTGGVTKFAKWIKTKLADQLAKIPGIKVKREYEIKKGYIKKEEGLLDKAKNLLERAVAPHKIHMPSMDQKPVENLPESLKKRMIEAFESGKSKQKDIVVYKDRGEVEVKSGKYKGLYKLEVKDVEFSFDVKDLENKAKKEIDKQSKKFLKDVGLWDLIKEIENNIKGIQDSFKDLGKTAKGRVNEINQTTKDVTAKLKTLEKNIYTITQEYYQLNIGASIEKGLAKKSMEGLKDIREAVKNGMKVIGDLFEDISDISNKTKTRIITSAAALKSLTDLYRGLLTNLANSISGMTAGIENKLTEVGAVQGGKDYQELVSLIDIQEQEKGKTVLATFIEKKVADINRGIKAIYGVMEILDEASNINIDGSGITANFANLKNIINTSIDNIKILRDRLTNFLREYDALATKLREIAKKEISLGFTEKYLSAAGISLPELSYGRQKLNLEKLSLIKDVLPIEGQIKGIIEEINKTSGKIQDIIGVLQNILKYITSQASKRISEVYNDLSQSIANQGKLLEEAAKEIDKRKEEIKKGFNKLGKGLEEQINTLIGQIDKVNNFINSAADIKSKEKVKYKLEEIKPPQESAVYTKPKLVYEPIKTEEGENLVHKKVEHIIKFVSGYKDKVLEEKLLKPAEKKKSKNEDNITYDPYAKVIQHQFEIGGEIFANHLKRALKAAEILRENKIKDYFDKFSSKYGDEELRKFNISFNRDISVKLRITTPEFQLGQIIAEQKRAVDDLKNKLIKAYSGVIDRYYYEKFMGINNKVTEDLKANLSDKIISAFGVIEGYKIITKVELKGLEEQLKENANVFGELLYESLSSTIDNLSYSISNNLASGLTNAWFSGEKIDQEELGAKIAQSFVNRLLQSSFDFIFNALAAKTKKLLAEGISKGFSRVKKTTDKIEGAAPSKTKISSLDKKIPSESKINEIDKKLAQKEEGLISNKSIKTPEKSSEEISATVTTGTASANQNTQVQKVGNGQAAVGAVQGIAAGAGVMIGGLTSYLAFDSMEHRFKEEGDTRKATLAKVGKILSILMMFFGLFLIIINILTLIQLQTMVNALKPPIPIAAAAEGGIFPGKFVPVKAFAEGGIVNRPTLGLIAEAGYSEAVIPLKYGYVPVKVKQPKSVQNIFYKQEVKGPVIPNISSTKSFGAVSGAQFGENQERGGITIINVTDKQEIAGIARDENKKNADILYNTISYESENVKELYYFRTI